MKIKKCYSTLTSIYIKFCHTSNLPELCIYTKDTTAEMALKSAQNTHKKIEIGNFRSLMMTVKLVPGSRFLVPGSRFLVPGSRFLVPGSRFLVPGSRFLVPGSRFLVPGSWFPVSGSRFLVLGSRFLVPASWI